MTENKRNILSFLIISCICLVATYLVSIYFVDRRFLKKDFLVAISSGIFASSFVVFFSEFLKYNLKKKNIENALYGNLRELYRQLISQIKYTEMLFAYPQTVVAENVYSASVPAINTSVSAIRFLQYEPFITNVFVISLHRFQQNEIPLLEKYMTACMTFPEIAILKTKIEKSDYGVHEYAPIVSDEKVSETLATMKIEAEKRCLIVNELIELLDKNCGHRFDWKRDRVPVDAFSFEQGSKDIHAFFENN